MKVKLTWLWLCFFIQTIVSQNIHEYYADGKIYAKLNLSAAKTISAENPQNISLEKFGELNKLFRKYGVTKVSKPFYQAKDDEILPKIIRIHFTQVENVEDFIAELQRSTGIEYAEKVPLPRTDVFPNEYSASSASVHLAQINAPQAWNVFNGNSNITVAIVDNAVMWTHVDLVANTYTNTGEIPNNGIDDDGNGYVDDVNGFNVADNNNNAIPTNLGMDHGTHCAGIAGARTDNNIGVASIGWNIKIIPVAAQNSTANPSIIPYGYEGIVYAVKAKAKIISCSFGNAGSSITEQSVINYAWNRGAIIIASAGNANSSTPNYPAAYNHVYAVAAVNPSDVKSAISNYGNWVDISAPGVNILSTVPYSTIPAYINMSGTSMAAPMVAGLAALMLSKSPNMSQTDVLNCISSTAANIYAIGGNTAYATGNQLGAGRIDAFAAMNCAATYSAIPPVANFSAFPLNSCPNTPIAFTDSSQYTPTSWNWTFQGGTPATSTLANPLVQWSSPGTYSVSLLATNANGNNTKTKLSYITITNAGSLPFNEGFQASQFLPSGWTKKNIMNDEIYWERKTGVGGYGTSTACAMFDNYTYFAPGERDEMWSPKFNFGNVINARLRFDVAYARYDQTFSDSLEVKLSTNCGVNWSSIYIKGGTTLATVPDQNNLFVPTAMQWRRDSIDISAAASGQGNVLFSFINRGHFGQPIYLDNINLAFPVPTLSTQNATAVCVGAPVNFSNTSAGSSGYTWNFQAASPPVSNSVNPVVTYSAPGSYTFSLSGSNGTSTATITKTIQVYSVPSLSVAMSSTSICSGATVSLTANGASNYSWSTGSSSASVQVTPIVTTVYTISGTNGGICTSVTTRTIDVTTTPTLTVNDQTICPGGSATIIALGAAGYSWSTGAFTNSIVVSPLSNTIYTVTGNNSNCVDTRTVNVFIGSTLPLTIMANPSAMCIGSSATLQVNGATNYTWSNGSNGTVIVVNPNSSSSYSVFGAAGNCTGSAVSNITVSPTPSLTVTAMPAGTICAGNSVTLTATGAPSFTWSNGSNQSQIVVTPSNAIVYTVTGTNPGCSNTETIGIVTGVSNLTLSISVSNPTLCAGKSTTLSATGANSYTWNTGAQSSSLTVNPTVTTGYTVSGSNAGCTGSLSSIITVASNPESVLTTTGTICDAPCQGIINAITNGGSLPYTYSLSNGCNNLPCGTLCQGLYTLYTTDAAGCSSFNLFSISCTVAADLKTKENTAGFSMYPNPASGKLFIETSEERITLRIFNNLGQILLEQSSSDPLTLINLEKLAKGLYYVELNFNSGILLKKLIVE